jgi:hypothetical protein
MKRCNDDVLEDLLKYNASNWDEQRSPFLQAFSLGEYYQNLKLMDRRVCLGVCEWLVAGGKEGVRVAI